MSDTGGPAFAQPLLELEGRVFEAGEISPTSGGMTLLDYFAGQALAQPKDFINIVKLAGEWKCSPSEAMARICYDFAGAMIAEKRRRETAK